MSCIPSLLQSGGDVSGKFLVIHPEEPLTAEGQTFTVELKIDYGGLEDVKLYHSNSNSFSTWSTVDVDVSDGKATFQATEGGVYVAKVDSNIGVVIGAVVGCLLLVALVIVGTVWYFRKHPSKLSHMKRSLTSRIWSETQALSEKKNPCFGWFDSMQNWSINFYESNADLQFTFSLKFQITVL